MGVAIKLNPHQSNFKDAMGIFYRIKLTHYYDRHIEESKSSIDISDVNTDK